MKFYILDIETRSEIDLPRCGIRNYAAHDSTDVLCLWIYDTGKHKYYSWHKTIDSHTEDEKVQYDSEEELKAILKNVDFTNAVFIAHNSSFEENIWEEILYKRYCFPQIKTTQWFCTMAQAAFNGLPQSLEKLSLLLNCIQTKDKKGHAQMLKMCKPRKPTKNNPAKWIETYADIEILSDYCKQDVATTNECFKRMPMITDYEYNVWLLDQKINRIGVPVDVPFIDGATRLIEKLKKITDERLKEITEGHVSTGKQQKAMVKYFNLYNIPITDSTRETMEGLLTSNAVLESKDKDIFLEVINIRLGALYTSLAKYQKMKDSVTPNGRIPYNFNYYGASTGRWAGRNVQLQNLPRGEIAISEDQYQNDIRNTLTLDKTFQKQIISNITTPKVSDQYPHLCKLYAASIRSTINTLSEPDTLFLDGDYSSIEARTLLWLSKDWAHLEYFKTGGDLYKEFAASVYHTPFNEVNSEQRRLGKTAILGLGFGMGADKFIVTAQNYGINISPEEAHKIKNLYRQMFTCVVQAWSVTERSAIEAISNKSIATDFTGIVWEYKVINTTPFLLCTLPSGRSIKYPYPCLIGDQMSYSSLNPNTKKIDKMKTYGARLIENIVQGIARDILADAMLRLDKAGYKIILTAHDEILCQVNKNSVKLKDFLDIMKEPPSWCTGLPIEVSGWEGQFYKKD